MKGGLRMLGVSLLGILGVAVIASLAFSADQEKLTIGAVEEVILFPPGFPAVARVDTGAATSSLDARDIRVRGRGEARSVRFTLVADDGRRTTLDLPLERYHSVATSDSAPERRPTVRMEICLAGVRIPAVFTLNDRSQMEYRVLLGRNILAGHFVVDVERSHMTQPTCASR